MTQLNGEMAYMPAEVSKDLFLKQWTIYIYIYIVRKNGHLAYVTLSYITYY